MLYSLFAKVVLLSRCMSSENVYALMLLREDLWCNKCACLHSPNHAVFCQFSSTHLQKRAGFFATLCSTDSYWGACWIRQYLTTQCSAVGHCQSVGFVLTPLVTCSPFNSLLTVALFYVADLNWTLVYWNDYQWLTTERYIGQHFKSMPRHPFNHDIFWEERQLRKFLIPHPLSNTLHFTKHGMPKWFIKQKVGHRTGLFCFKYWIMRRFGKPLSQFKAAILNTLFKHHSWD